jgi:hypothetical protein
MSDDGREKLHRFNVAHASCGGVSCSELTEADLEVIEGALLRVWVSGRCNGCGATIRESSDAAAMMTELTALVEAAGITPADLRRTLESGDSAAIDTLSEKVTTAPDSAARVSRLDSEGND